MEGLPVTLVVKGRRCVVIGGGAVAARKVELLLRAGADVLVVAPRLIEALRAPAVAGRIRDVARDFAPRDLAGAALVIAATDDRAVNAAAAAAARKRAIPVNVVDDPALCTVTMPAIIERGPVSVAISTGGASPTLARRLRAGIERALPWGIGALADFAAAHRRAVKEALPGVEARRRFWDEVLDGPVAAAVVAGRPREAEAMLRAALARGAAMPRRGRVALVGAGPGDPELLTLKALRLIERADAIVHDALVGEGILDLARRDAERIFVGKRRGAACMPQHDINALLVRLARRGKLVVRLKGGDPFMFGRGGEECQALRAAGIACEVVPGITAALGCAAAAGIPLTHRDHAASCVFVTAHRRNGRLDLDWRALARPRQTLCIYMGLSVIGELMANLAEAGLRRGTPAALIDSGTTRRQRVVAGTIGDLAARAAEAGVGGPALLIVGEVAALAAAAPAVQPRPSQASAPRAARMPVAKQA
jgi:uroporphyrin-III C-methyltransferase/precorrin-2 dehydrogenase/sirohydrochlorin ferrochelatase